MQLSQSRFQRGASIKRSPQIGIKLAGYKCTHQSLPSFKSLLMPAPNLFLVHSFSYVEWDSKSYPFESLIFWGNWECKCFKIKWDCWYYLIHFPDKWENVLRCTQRVRNQRAPENSDGFSHHVTFSNGSLMELWKFLHSERQLTTLLLCVNQIAANFVNERVPRGNNAIIRHVKLKNTAISFSENPIILITVDYIFASQWFSIRSAFL